MSLELNNIAEKTSQMEKYQKVNFRIKKNGVKTVRFIKMSGKEI